LPDYIQPGTVSNVLMIERPSLPSRLVSARVSFVIAAVIFFIVFLANSWVGDDAYITFRVSENLINGYGPRWNVDERVQVFTNPLWMFTMAAAAWVTGEFFYTSLAVSLLLCLTMLAIVWRWLGRTADGWLVLALLLSSKAFIDYSSSGLEYPLTYLLLASFAVLVLGARRPAAEERADRLPLLVLIASLAFVNRADMVLLYVPALLWLFVRRLRGMTWREARGLLLASAPAWGWLLFAIIYYGFPFPNTYYAKAQSGMPDWLQLRQGLAYTASSLRFDPITIATILAAAGISWAVGHTRARLLALGALAYVFYTIRVGGDFMAGRFFAAPFLVSALIFAYMPKKRLTALAVTGLIVVWNVVNPLAPLKSTPDLEMGWNWRLQNGVKDDRGATAGGVNPLTFEIFRRMPDNAMAREARSLHASPDRVIVHPWIGEIGFWAGPGKYVIDPNALSDPLLARLPIPPSFYYEFWVSHFTRELPAGYVESRQAKKNLIHDPLIKGYFQKILNVTTGPVFSTSRFRDIYDLNVRMRDFQEQVKAQQRLDTVVRVTNPLFWTHVGQLDQRASWMRSDGRRGYLLLGPGTPLSPGTFTVRWHGNTDQPGKADLGFVEVCHDDCRSLLARNPIHVGANDLLGEATVRLKEEARDVEFRLWVNERSGINVWTIGISQQE
jgi:arabinofuranosyltransferase